MLHRLFNGTSGKYLIYMYRKQSSWCSKASIGKLSAKPLSAQKRNMSAQLRTAMIRAQWNPYLEPARPMPTQYARAWAPWKLPIPSFSGAQDGWNKGRDYFEQIDKEWGWCAGLLSGEGKVTIRPCKEDHRMYRQSGLDIQYVFDIGRLYDNEVVAPWHAWLLHGHKHPGCILLLTYTTHKPVPADPA